MKKISIMTPCYNEEGNVGHMHEQVKSIMQSLPNYEYEHLFIDNCSTDNTRTILEAIAKIDDNVKLIFNLRNFGPARSSAYGLFQTTGNAAICLACDFQDPPELIPKFIEKWEKGALVVWGQKTSSEEKKSMFFVRSLYYKIIKRFSKNKEYEHVTGFGLYDRSVITYLEAANEPVPNFRNLVTEFGYSVELIQYQQPLRRAGKSSYNFISYLDAAIGTFIMTSRAPIRIATICGFIMSGISFLVGVFYLIMKLLFWDRFGVGIAPLIIGIFFIGSIQLLFTGIIGEYIGEILNRVTKRPLVIESKRINSNIETKIISPDK